MREHALDHLRLFNRGDHLQLAATRAALHVDVERALYQNRPRIFDRHIVLPELLYGAVHEINERIGAAKCLRRSKRIRRGAQSKRPTHKGFAAPPSCSCTAIVIRGTSAKSPRSRVHADSLR